MGLAETLIRVQKALKMNQRELAELLQCSTRTVIRFYQRGGILTPRTFERLATACHPHDPALATELAAQAGKTLVQLGLERAPPPPAPVLPSARRAPPSSKHMADSIVCAAAEAMQKSPHAMRPALVAAFERAIALGMTAEEVLEGLVEGASAHAQGSSTGTV